MDKESLYKTKHVHANYIRFWCTGAICLFKKRKAKKRKISFYSTRAAHKTLIRVHRHKRVEMFNLMIHKRRAVVTHTWLMWGGSELSAFATHCEHCRSIQQTKWKILNVIKLMKGKAPRKHSLHEKTAASVLWKLFISSNEWCHTTDAP